MAMVSDCQDWMGVVLKIFTAFILKITSVVALPTVILFEQ